MNYICIINPANQLYSYSVVLVVCLVFPFSHHLAKAQNCLPDGFKFTSQSEIDNFILEYPDCKEIVGEVIVQEKENGNITNLNGFRNIHTFHAGLEIHENQALENLKGLEQLISIKARLNIYSNLALKSLEGIENLKTIEGSLRVSSSPSLENLKPLAGLELLTRDLSISSNPKLANLNGLNNLPAIGGFLIISDNKNMSTFQGLDKVTSIGNSVLIQDNPKLEELSGFNNIESIGSNLIIENNAALNSARGLDNLRSVDGNLLIVGNPKLFDINALQKLESINGILQILENKELISLSGLDNIDTSGIEDLALLNSFRLFECQVKSICDYLNDESHGAAIQFNAEGCSTREEILSACNRLGEGRNSAGTQSSISFFPNPTLRKVTVEGRGVATADLRIIDQWGRILRSQKMTSDEINLEGFGAGVYFLELQTKSELAIGRIVKLVE